MSDFQKFAPPTIADYDKLQHLDERKWAEIRQHMSLVPDQRAHVMIFDLMNEVALQLLLDEDAPAEQAEEAVSASKPVPQFTRAELAWAIAKAIEGAVASVLDWANER